MIININGEEKAMLLEVYGLMKDVINECEKAIINKEDKLIDKITIRNNIIKSLQKETDNLILDK